MQYTANTHTVSSQQLVTTWLRQRQALLVTLYDLCHQRPFFLKLNGEALQSALQEFGDKY